MIIAAFILFESLLTVLKLSTPTHELKGATWMGFYGLIVFS